MERRKFIAAGIAGAATGCRRPAPRSSWRFFTAEQGRTMEALCAHIVPEDQDPGAVRAGVVDFIDRQLTRFYKPLQAVYKRGIADVENESVAATGRAFPDLPPKLQLDVIGLIEKNPGAKPFFDLLVAHTMQGYYGDPRHGGNRERASWKMLRLPYPPVRGRA
jgi:gluconate 2-dehydrogenase gamma chain